MNFEELEQKHQTYSRKSRQVWLVGIIVGVFCSIVGFIFTPSPNSFLTPFLIIPFFFLPLLFVSSIGIIFVASRDWDTYKKYYKGYFMSKILSSTLQNYHYQRDGMDKKILASTGMVDTGNTYLSNDLVSGNYKNCHFYQADVTIKKDYTDNHEITVFKGRWMVFEYHTKFNYRLEIVGRKFRIATTPEGLNRHELESIDFNHSFRLYAENGFETYYILNPAIIDKIEQLGAKYKYDIILCFVDNCLHVGINNNKDSFEPPRPRTPLNEQVEFQKNYTDIKLVTDIIDALKLSS